MDKKWPNWIDRLKSPQLEGGLRLKSQFKSSASEKPLVSFVTVVRNNIETLERTIQSVINQTYDNVEHIILDGASTDGTLDLILKYEKDLDYYASEPDAGLYDALNKAIPLCRGDLILVLNSDDWLSDNSAAYAAKNYIESKAQLICGTAKVLISKEEFIEWQPQVVSSNSYFTVPNLNHNAVYASKKAYELSGKYDTSYFIAADSKWILSCYDNGVDFVYTDTILVNYSLGGISSDIYWHMEECKRIIKEKFRFLTGDEVISLHYIYYQWREGFKYPLVGFNASGEIKKMVEKYAEKEQFISAINMENDMILQNVILDEQDALRIQSNLIRFKKQKDFLKKFPFLFKITKKIYLSIKG
jgi:glycosyltransferase involved in cell wall biosynthesis